MLSYFFGERKSVFLVRYCSETRDTAFALTGARNDLKQIAQVTFWQKAWAQIYVPMIARHVFHGTERIMLLLLNVSHKKMRENTNHFVSSFFCVVHLHHQLCKTSIFFFAEIHPFCNASLPGEWVYAISCNHRLPSSHDYSLKFLGTAVWVSIL